MFNLFLEILLVNFEKVKNFGEKNKIFDAFNRLAKMGYNLNISITYLFENNEISKYIEDKVLRATDNKEKDTGTEMDNTKPNLGFKEKDIRQLFYAMVIDTIEAIL